MADLSRVIEIELPSGDTAPVVRRRFGQGERRVVIAAGIRGDAPEGIRVAHRVGAYLEEHEDRLSGTVDIFPCANPLAAHRGTRNWPFFDTDLNRLFPGKEDGHPPAQVARALCNDIAGAEQVIELRGARPAFSEASQAIVRHDHDVSAELAMHANVSVVWRRQPGPAAPATFAHQFPGSIVLEGGTGNRLTTGVGNDLADGVLNLLVHLGVLPDEGLPFHWAAIQRPLPKMSPDQRMPFQAEYLFLAEALHHLPPGATVLVPWQPHNGSASFNVSLAIPHLLLQVDRTDVRWVAVGERCDVTARPGDYLFRNSLLDISEPGLVALGQERGIESLRALRRCYERLARGGVVIDRHRGPMRSFQVPLQHPEGELVLSRLDP